MDFVPFIQGAMLSVGPRDFGPRREISEAECALVKVLFPCFARHVNNKKKFGTSRKQVLRR